MINARKVYMLVFMLATSLMVLVPTDAFAEEECGWYCERSVCGHAWFQSSPPFLYGHWNYGEYCRFNACRDCQADELVADTNPSVSEIVVALESADVSSMDALYEAYGDRLLLERSRGFIVIRGGCDGQTPTNLVYVSDEVIEGFDVRGVSSLAEYLEGFDESFGAHETSKITTVKWMLAKWKPIQIATAFLGDIVHASRGLLVG